jgi:hypothetical protein
MVDAALPFLIRGILENLISTLAFTRKVHHVELVAVSLVPFGALATKLPSSLSA